MDWTKVFKLSESMGPLHDKLVILKSNDNYCLLHQVSMVQYPVSKYGSKKHSFSLYKVSDTKHGVEYLCRYSTKKEAVQAFNQYNKGELV